LAEEVVKISCFLGYVERLSSWV
jgi:putative IMPACT (imprinted ancient) family translation regulator